MSREEKILDLINERISKIIVLGYSPDQIDIDDALGSMG